MTPQPSSLAGVAHFVAPHTALSMKIRNYRAFQDSGEFRLAPLTLLVGANGSGKTSIMSALLVLKQSIEQELIGSRVGQLTLSGPYCDLGQYKDAVFGHKNSRTMRFTIGVPMHLLFDTRPSEPLVRLAVPQAQRAGRDFRLPRYYKPTIARPPRRGTARLTLEFQTDEPFGPSLSRVIFKADDIGSVNCVRTTRGERRQHWRTYADILPPQSISVMFRRTMLFPYFYKRDAVYEAQPPRTKERINRFVMVAQLASEYLRRMLAASEPMGPFRTPPERRYAFTGFTTTRAGISGANTPSLLITEKLLRSKGRPLQHAVRRWLEHLQLADNVAVEDIARGANLYHMTIRGPRRKAAENMADVGYGISQILPVIVQGLLVPRGGIYMVQQPELHLHPDAQAAIADYFIYLVESGVRVIVETHSEYLVLRVRRRIAEAESRRRRTKSGAQDRISREKASVLWVENGAGGATVTELTIGAGFQFENLPEGFMSQALDDRLSLLATVARHG